VSDFWVLDASAILAFLGQEPGADVVKAALYDGAVVSSVNLCEVAGKLVEAGLSHLEMMDVFSNLGLEVKDFDSQ
jgi:PIN domain nuclease of toxin-antitoxin system